MAKILVVDDEVRIRDFLRVALTRSGYQVTTVPSASQALSEVASQIFDLILLDIQMPGESGVSLLEKVRKSQNRVPVVVFSGMITSETEKELRKNICVKIM